MIFVIPMAGESPRFYDAGYAEPKYRLMVRRGTPEQCQHLLEPFGPGRKARS
jgi:hypothetical protein